MKARKLPSGSWNIRVFAGTENGKRHYVSFTAETKAEVLYKAAKYHKEGKPKTHPMTVGEAVDKYIALSATLSPTTLDSYRKIRCHAFPDLVDRSVKDLTDQEIQVSINAESLRTTYTGHTIAPKTVRCEWSLFATALKTICGKTYSVRLPKSQPKLKELPDPQKVIEIVRGTDIELPCLLAIWCGLRLSEIKGLTRDSIHGDELFIDKIKVYANGQEIMKDTAKTATSKRKVRCPGYIMALIPDQDVLVPQSRNAIHHKFRRLMAKNGIDMTFHGLRHMYASISLSVLQIPSKSVQVSGGWATPYVMDKVYSQTYDAIQRDADKRRDDYFNGLMHHEYASQGPENVEK